MGATKESYSQLIEGARYYDCVVEETMRMASPVMFSDLREFTKNCTIQNRKFYKGEWVWVPLGFNTRKERKFVSPNQFDPSRFEKK